uniref:Uncharacterized protein n=1 Tax=Ciona savignyi TaxID=51511 RepID=H2ZAV2_CIOSA
MNVDYDITFNVFVLSFLFISIKSQNKMGTRYWDEIDWYIKEGTDKLCEILNIGEEEEKSTNDNKQPTAWSTTTADAESNNTTEKENTNETGIDKTSCDRGSDIEEERPTSVEAATLGLKGKTKVDELSLWCRENRVYPPVFTLVVNTETDHITTVDLWNGLKFQSTSKPTLELAKEECSSAALTYIHSSQYREQPNPVVYQPTMPAYYVQDANQAFPAFPAMHPIPPPQMMMSPNHVMSQNHVMSSMMPYMQPPVINPYVMGADGLLYPRYFPATKYQYPPLPPGALPRYTPAVPPPRLSGHQVDKGLLHHNPRGHSNSVPKQFVPSQVECHSPSKSINTSSQNYILSDSPLPPSGDKCTTSRATESRPRKSKATLAISFANST